MGGPDAAPIYMLGSLRTLAGTNTSGSTPVILTYGSSTDQGAQFHLTSGTGLTGEAVVGPLFQGAPAEINMNGKLELPSEVSAPLRQFRVRFNRQKGELAPDRMTGLEENESQSKEPVSTYCTVHGEEIEDTSSGRKLFQFSGAFRTVTDGPVIEVDLICVGTVGAQKRSTTTSLPAAESRPLTSARSEPKRQRIDNQVVDKKSDCLGGDGYSHDKREKARKAAQNFVDKLMRARPREIRNSNGMTFLSSIPDLETGVKGRPIVVRKITAAFWDECIKLVDTRNRRYRIVAVGASGIGKTTSTPLLIRKLLSKDNTVVVYLLRTKSGLGWYYEFVAKGGIYTANVYPERLSVWSIKSLKTRATYYIVDPGNTNDGCQQDLTFMPKLIIVASPDERHWGGENFFRGRCDVAGFWRDFPVWSEDELIAARQQIRPGLTKEKLLERYKVFGGCPRQIFDDDARHNEHGKA
jgi:hypothetical protein